MCHCASCHETFGSIKSFDRHRTGGHCKTPQQLALTYSTTRRCWIEAFSWKRPGTDVDHNAQAVLHAYAHQPLNTITTSSVMAGLSRTIIAPTPDELAAWRQHGHHDTDGPHSRDW